MTVHEEDAFPTGSADVTQGTATIKITDDCVVAEAETGNYTLLFASGPSRWDDGTILVQRENGNIETWDNGTTVALNSSTRGI